MPENYGYRLPITMFSQKKNQFCVIPITFCLFVVVKNHFEPSGIKNSCEPLPHFAFEYMSRALIGTITIGKMGGRFQI